MSHRTKDLPPLTGLSHAVRELRYHEASRQGLAVVLILVYALVATPSELSIVIGIPVAVAGMLVRFYASGFVTKNKELATDGPYALVRHPLYTGNVLLIIGFAIACATVWAVPLALAFFCFYYPPAIDYEDRKLRRLFGEQWDNWASEVPALMPNLHNVNRMGGGGWSLAKSMQRNGEPVIVVYTLFCLWLLIDRLG